MVEQYGKSSGFAQLYMYHHRGEDWHGDMEFANTFSIDDLIGDIAYLGRGLGKGNCLCTGGKIRERPDAKRIIVRPEPEKKASCGALISCGFSYDAKNEIYVMSLAERPS